eukprot:TRINITY_DN9622_c0_g1_i2.p1 TRINITY_DN9622_c0_g1~~TRINITY_DN9622_c0_g1_i2.p1  ORF type:complete len:482 (-),score=105.37 TRINITY_DN9622_c0_g1_i2:138-1583(-)
MSAFSHLLSLIRFGLTSIGLVAGLILVGLAAFIIAVRLRVRTSRDKRRTIVFFHPFCNAAGGGEKVLWLMVASLLKKYREKVRIIIWSGESASVDEILTKTQTRFNVKIAPEDVTFRQLHYRRAIVPMPFLTMILQVLGMIFLTAEGLWRYPEHADYFIDTTGLGFTYALVKLCLPRALVGCYVHYPFISTDMVSKVRTGRDDYNNSQRIARSPLLSRLKQNYYLLLLQTYIQMGRFLDFVMTNSSWTHAHIASLWGNRLGTKRFTKLFPPCTVSVHSQNFSAPKKEKLLISFAQFRPEKRHNVQLRIFADLKEKHPEVMKDVKFWIMGSVRGPEDGELLNELRSQVDVLGLKDQVSFKVDLKFSEILDIFKKASFGLHTMEAEHFGIGIVEMMAAGIIVVAHNSAGPREDIIQEASDFKSQCGFLAKSEEEYCDALLLMIKNYNNNSEQLSLLRQNAIAKAESFSDERFQEKFLSIFESL